MDPNGDGGSAPDFLSYLEQLESGGRNIPNTTQGTSSGQAQGYDQITTGTWREFAPAGGVDLNKYPNALSAPIDVQRQVAKNIPLERWDPKTLAGLKAAGFSIQPNRTLGENIAANSSANLGILTGSPQQDFLGGGANPIVARAAANAAAGINPKPPAPLDLSAQPQTDFLGTVAPSTAAPPEPASGAIPIPVHPVTGGGTPTPSNVVDPTEPVAQQLATAGRNALGYFGPQVSGIPGAVAQDYSNATARNVLGNTQLNNGDVLPSFPSRDPSTWGAGGVLNALGGMAGQIASPLTGAVRQLIEQPVTEATGSPAIGERAGVVANSLATPVAGRLLAGAPSALSNAAIGALPAEDAQLASLATQKYGIPLTAPQLSTSPGLKIASSALNRLPLSGAGGDIAEQQTAFNRAVAGTLGESADRITPDVMNRARARIGSYYDSVAANTDIKIDQPFLQGLHDTLDQAQQVLPKAEVEPLIKQAQAIISKIDPQTKTISGATYQALTNTGSPLDRLLGSTDPNVSHYANGLKTALDSALERSAPPEAQDLLRTADKQWASMRTIQPIVAKSPTGDVSPALLAGRVNAATGNGMAFGYGGDLGELARIGQRFLKEPGSSNTAERGSALMAAAKIGALPGAILATHPSFLGAVSPAQMVGGALSIPSTLLAGRVAGGALRSPWLANALINRSLNPASAPAISPSLGLLGGGAALLNKPVNALGAPNQ